MPPRTLCRAGVGLALCTLISLGLLACSADEGLDAGDAQREGALAADSIDSMHLGRVHLIIEPTAETDDEDRDYPALEITARFIQYRGFAEGFVRSSFELSAPVHERLAIGECTPTDALEASELWDGEQGPGAAAGLRDESLRELLLLDAGNISVHLGELRFDLGLALIPDLLPYVAGVEYIHTVDALDGFLPGEEREAITIEVDGADDDELPGFIHRADMPAPLALRDATGTFERDTITLRWRESQLRGADALPLTLRLTSLSSAEQTGREITCVVPDSGEARLDLRELGELGLGGSGDVLSVEASRVAITHFETGDFVDGEVLVEVRDRYRTRLP